MSYSRNTWTTGEVVTAAKLNNMESGILTANTNISLLHRNIYRGQSLGTAFTTAQASAISAGTFDNMYIGDYWTIGSVTWRIADFDYWYNTGDTNCTTHHIVIVPDESLVSGRMNSSNDTTTGYTNSEFRLTSTENTARTTAISKATSAFTLSGTSHILSHRQIFSTASSGGASSAWAWTDETVELMNEVMVYGAHAWSAKHGYDVGSEKTQLALFALNPSKINTRYTYWLRDVASATSFAYVGNNGLADRYYASGSLGIRPAFAVK